MLPPLCPLPGTVRPAAAARPSAAAGPERPADERILGKIRALLAKAESTEFTEEAEALSARAQELMAKYSIDHALLAAEAGRKDEPASRRLPVITRTRGRRRSCSRRSPGPTGAVRCGTRAGGCRR